MKGNILKNYIDNRPETLTQLSEMSKIDKAILSRVSNGIKPSVNTTLKLAKILGEKTLTVEGNEIELGIYLKIENLPLEDIKI